MLCRQEKEKGLQNKIMTFLLKLKQIAKKQTTTTQNEKWETITKLLNKIPPTFCQVKIITHRNSVTQHVVFTFHFFSGGSMKCFCSFVTKQIVYHFYPHPCFRMCLIISTREQRQKTHLLFTKVLLFNFLPCTLSFTSLFVCFFVFILHFLEE